MDRSAPVVAYPLLAMLPELRERLSLRLKTVPTLFWPLARLREDGKKRVVRRDSDIVIEGFWRCGNHFATYAFIVAQPRPVQVAHHFHAPAQLMLAAQWGVPGVLLIRNPVDAVASSAIYLRRDPRPMLRLYTIFHQSLVPYADRLVVSDFDDTVGDFGAVIEQVNRRFGRSFDLYRGDDASRAEVERRIRKEHEANMGADAGRLPLPSEEKARQKQAVIDRIREPACAALVQEAESAYDRLRSYCGSGVGPVTKRASRAGAGQGS